jgi:catalase
MKYTKPNYFPEIGKEASNHAFSTVEANEFLQERDPRGFAMKFYTEDGNWDLVGNNTPVFFVKDPKKNCDLHPKARSIYQYEMPNDDVILVTELESLHQVLDFVRSRNTLWIPPRNGLWGVIRFR